MSITIEQRTVIVRVVYTHTVLGFIACADCHKKLGLTSYVRTEIHPASKDAEPCDFCHCNMLTGSHEVVEHEVIIEHTPARIF